MFFFLNYESILSHCLSCETIHSTQWPFLVEYLDVADFADVVPVNLAFGVRAGSGILSAATLVVAALTEILRVVLLVRVFALCYFQITPVSHILFYHMERHLVLFLFDW